MWRMGMVVLHTKKQRVIISNPPVILVHYVGTLMLFSLTTSGRRDTFSLDA